MGAHRALQKADDMTILPERSILIRVLVRGDDLNRDPQVVTIDQMMTWELLDESILGGERLLSHMVMSMWPQIEATRSVMRGTPPPLDTSVHLLRLSRRALNGLRLRRIHTLGELITLTPSDLLRQFGRKSLREVEDALARVGLQLTPDRDQSGEIIQ